MQQIYIFKFICINYLPLRRINIIMFKIPFSHVKKIYQLKIYSSYFHICLKIGCCSGI